MTKPTPTKPRLLALIIYLTYSHSHKESRDAGRGLDLTVPILDPYNRELILFIIISPGVKIRHF